MPSSTEHVSNLFLGEWSSVTFRETPLGAFNDIYLGAIRDGSLEVAREDFTYEGTTYPKVVEAVFPQSVSMSFTGNMEEIHKRNMHLALGELASEASNYVYPGATCTAAENYGSLEMKRQRCQDSEYIVAWFWKTTGAGTITLGVSDEVVPLPVTFNALNDTNGTYGGSAAQPLGWIWTPDPVV